MNCSVLIPYCCKPESISNVLNAAIRFREELKPWTLCEILILIDGPTHINDDLPPIGCIALEKKNRGLANARNVLINEAKGNF